jgi:hypothetical protein
MMLADQLCWKTSAQLEHNTDLLADQLSEKSQLERTNSESRAIQDGISEINSVK